MKLIIGLVALLTLANPLLAQTNNFTVSLTVIGNKNLRVTVDNREQVLGNSSTTGNTTTGTIDRLIAGQHTLVITRMDLNTNRQSPVNTVFLLRNGYDLDITVNGNGSLEMIESKRGGVYNDDPPMGNTAFSNLLRSVRAQRSTSQKASVISTAFNNSSNYFTVAQVDQLLRLIDLEATKLQLAKQSYSHLTDPDNFNQLYYLFNSDYSRTELYDYVYNYNTGNTGGGGTGGNYAMSDNDFNVLYQNLRQQWPPATQVNAIAEAFNNTNNYFTVAQSIRMITLVNSEANRLRLAKLSYRAVVDRNNFTLVYNLLSYQSSRDELTAYVTNYDNNNNGGGNAGGAMTDYDFQQLYNNIKSEWPVSAQLNMGLSAFNDRYNRFTTAQVARIMQLFSFDDDRLQLAKAAYRAIIDRNNINQLYEALTFQNSKDDLRRYISSYREDTNNNTRIPMSDGNFSSLKSSVQQKFFPGEKFSTLQDIFNNTSYYFTSSQAKQLVELVSLESNRLALAKLSYRTITDRSNFRQVIDLLANQSNRTELEEYVRNYRD